MTPDFHTDPEAWKAHCEQLSKLAHRKFVRTRKRWKVPGYENVTYEKPAPGEADYDASDEDG